MSDPAMQDFAVRVQERPFLGVKAFNVVIVIGPNGTVLPVGFDDEAKAHEVAAYLDEALRPEQERQEEAIRRYDTGFSGVSGSP